jgi:hypothetical protein
MALNGYEAALFQKRAAKAWEGIPEKYHPNPETPWRVGWGIGCFKDFPTHAEAMRFYDAHRTHEMIDEPFYVDADGAHYDRAPGGIS